MLTKIQLNLKKKVIKQNKQNPLFARNSVSLFGNNISAETLKQCAP